jgi:predicted nuclease of predicted toxin-antitoxin system
MPDYEIWLDTNLSPIIAKWLTELLEVPVKSAYVLNTHTQTDLQVYDMARKQGNVIFISKDSDFAELISRLGSPPKLIALKIGNCDNRSLFNFLKLNIKESITILTTSEIQIVELE